VDVPPEGDRRGGSLRCAGRDGVLARPSDHPVATRLIVVRTLLLLLGILLVPSLVPAQREPVLKQIKVPHSYYYREMYLPQLTSGPSAATWSPDGSELI
jgi:hypothetical protein